MTIEVIYYDDFYIQFSIGAQVLEFSTSIDYVDLEVERRAGGAKYLLKFFDRQIELNLDKKSLKELSKFLKLDIHESFVPENLLPILDIQGNELPF